LKVVIHFDQSYVLHYMYGQTINFNLQFLKSSKVVAFDYKLIKEIRVEREDHWSHLLSNVANHGCRDSFKKLFNHFYPLLVAQSLKSGLSQELAAELAQETMLRVWNQSLSFDAAKGSPALWIYVIARNLKYDYLRKIKNDPLRAASSDIYNDDASFAREANVEDLFDLAQLKTQIEKLSLDQRDIIHKIYFEGMTQQEIADENGIPLGTVKSRVRLAVATIKEMMEEKLK
jgi:RNA polymerase sigma-70 factor (ECF subfamily)